MEKRDTYTYFKIRKDFGRQPMFCEVPSYIIDSITPNQLEQREYGLRNPVHNSTQTSDGFAKHEVNTKIVVCSNRGINHKEGGWPSDINIADEEAVTRYLRRVERDDNYINAVMDNYPNFNHYIKQNNAIDMYTMYFKDFPSVDPPIQHRVFVSGKFQDGHNRPIGSIDWTYEDHAKIVVSYCDKTQQTHYNSVIDDHCLVWDIEQSNTPAFTLRSPSACWEIITSSARRSLFMGGLEDGRICLFDVRVMNKPVESTPKHVSHREPVSALVNIYSRNNAEFFSGSTDGKCLWWDLRNLKAPFESLIISTNISSDTPTTLEHSEPIGVLQYERTVPTKFLCGTATGLVFNVNRKGKFYKDKISSIIKTHTGAVKAIHRSPLTSKVFMTCGDWSLKIWNEDLHHSPILTSYNNLHSVSDATWAPKRVSSYITISSDGKFRYWDLLSKHHSPVASLPLSKKSLLKLKIHDEGKLVAVGDSNGTLHIVSLSDSLITSKQDDKHLMTHTLDRESRREHILELRIKEIRLNADFGKGKDVKPPVNKNDEALLLKKVEEQYKMMVRQEKI